MAGSASKPKPKTNVAAPLRPFASRPHLVGAIAAGIIIGLALAFIANPLRVSTRAILTWDAACAWFIVASLISMTGRSAADIKARARGQDDGRNLIMTFVLFAAAASIGAIARELSLAQEDDGAIKLVRIGLAVATVAASWFVVQLVFALHYAHEYYAAGESGLRGGLKFPGGEEPDYWDFLHFSVVIGVAAQTADIAFTSKSLRRIGTVHGVTAFIFNTVILALTINMVAGAAGGKGG